METIDDCTSDVSDCFESPSKNPETDEADLSSEFESSSSRKPQATKDDAKVPITGKAVSCQFCQSNFSTTRSVTRHLKICGKNPEKQKDLHICLSCGKKFARRYILQSHTQRCRRRENVQSEQNVKTDSNRINCIVPGCAQDFLFKTSLYKHLRNFHHKDLKQPTQLQFSSLDEFTKWKTGVEESSFSYYSQQYGKRNGKLYYYCQHDGNSKPHRKTGEPPRKTIRKNTKGSIKQDKLCMSMITAHCKEDGSVQVCFYPSHTHKCRARDLKHQPLSAETLGFIDKQLAWSVPPRKIVLNLRDDSYKRQNRSQKQPLRKENLIKVKNVTERLRKKKAKLRYADDDANSVLMKVKVLSEEPFNPVVIYKPKGEEILIGPEGSEHLPEDTFVLGIQTSDQLEMMTRHSKVILAMDETHGTNHYNYKLLNLVVKDEFNLGYPVGHLITSRSDEATLQFFFKAIKERCPGMSINCCITDDDPALINSLRSGFGEDIWHVLCIWHIHRTVQTKLREYVKDSQIVDEMYQVICVLIGAASEAEFYKVKHSFLREFGGLSKGFTSWFQVTFMPKASKWAMCFRSAPHGAVETTMLVESFHNQLKTVYLKRVPNRRIDDLLDLLLQIEEDFYTRWFNAKETEMLSAKDAKKIQDRHERGRKIKDEDVTHISGNFYSVRSQDKDVFEEYTVTKCVEACEETLCVFICTACVMCTHMYSCTCPDPTPPCKHIHKVHIMLNRDLPEQPLESINEEPVFYAAENIDLPVFPDEEAHPTKESDSLEKRIKLIKETINDVESQLENSPVKRFMLPRIQSILNDLNSQCKLLTGTSKDQVPVMEKQLSIGPNEKLQKQVKSFVRVKKQRNKNKLQRPTTKSVAEIKQYLFQESAEKIDDVPNLEDISPANVEPVPAAASQKPENEDEMINAFFNVLQKSNELVYVCDNHFTLALYEGNTYANLTADFAGNKFVLLPLNIEGNQCVAVCVDSCELLHYNPLSQPGDQLTKIEIKFFNVVARFMRQCFPLISKWTIKRHFDYQPKSCEVFICWFAYQVTLSNGESIPALADPDACRREIDDAILAWK